MTSFNGIVTYMNFSIEILLRNYLMFVLILRNLQKYFLGIAAVLLMLLEKGSVIHHSCISKQ